MTNPFDPSQPSFPSDRRAHPLEQRPRPAIPQPPQPTPPSPVKRVAFSQTRPFLSYAILALNVIVYLADVSMGGQLTMLGMKDNTAIMAGEWWRLVTPMFLHAGVAHLGVNSFSLYIIGPQVERSYGYWKFAVLYLLAGVAGAEASFVFSPYPSVGASGALFGLVGALLPLLYRNREVLADTRRRITSLIQVIVLNLIIGLIPGIDDWAHAGGLAGGLALGWFATPLYALSLDVDGTLRVRDQSAPQSAFLAAIIIGMLMGAVLYMEILLRQGVTFGP